MEVRAMHNDSGGIVGWCCTTFLFVVNMVTPQDWSYVMAGVAAGATAFFYVARTIEIIRGKKNDDGGK